MLLARATRRGNEKHIGRRRSRPSGSGGRCREACRTPVPPDRPRGLGDMRGGHEALSAIRPISWRPPVARAVAGVAANRPLALRCGHIGQGRPDATRYRSLCAPRIRSAVAGIQADRLQDRGALRGRLRCPSVERAAEMDPARRAIPAALGRRHHRADPGTGEKIAGFRPRQEYPHHRQRARPAGQFSARRSSSGQR